MRREFVFRNIPNLFLQSLHLSKKQLLSLLTQSMKKTRLCFSPSSPSPNTPHQQTACELTCSRRTGRQVSCSQWRPCFFATHQQGSLSCFGFLLLWLLHLSHLLYSRSAGRPGRWAEREGQVFKVIGPRCVNNDLPWYGSPGPLAMIGCLCINIPSLCLLQASIYKPRVKTWRAPQTQRPYSQNKVVRWSFVFCFVFFFFWGVLLRRLTHLA